MSGNQKWEQEQLFSLDKPSLKALSYVLRHKELWPQNFYWNFGYCDQCAMGLADRLWHMKLGKGVDASLAGVSKQFSLPPKTAETIFVSDWGYGMNYVYITPEIVADKIDEYLKSL